MWGGVDRWRMREWGAKEKETGEEWQSVTQRQRDGVGGADWVFAPWAQLAKGKPADSTTCHPTFYQQHSKLFLEDGSFNMRCLGLVSSLICACVCLSRAHGCTQLPTIPCWIISPRRPCWHFFMSFNSQCWICCIRMFRVWVCFQ